MFLSTKSNTPFTPGLRPRCDRILGFGRNDRGHSPSVSKTVVSIVSEVISHTLIPPSDRTATIRDRTATRKCTRSPANVNTTREKVSKNYKLKHSCVLWRFFWDLWARQRRSRAIPRRSHHDHGVLTTRLLRVSRVHGDLRAFLPRSHGDYILSRSNF